MRVIIFVLATIGLVHGGVFCPCARPPIDSQELPQVEEPEQIFPEIEGPSVDPLPSRTESHFYPNANHPVVAVHVTVDREMNTDLPAIDPMPELPPIWSKEEDEVATNFPAPEVMPPSFPWIRRFENLAWVVPETRPDPEQQPSDKPDSSIPLIPHEEDKPLVHYYPNIQDPIVSLQIVVDKVSEEYPTPQLPTPIFPFPVVLRRFLTPETKPLPENDGASVDPLPGIPEREPPSILEPESEEQSPIAPLHKQPIVEIVVHIKKPVLDDMPGENLPAPEIPTPIFPEPEGPQVEDLELLPETRPSLVPEPRRSPLAPELRPLPELELLAPETKPSLVPEVKPWPNPEEQEPTPLVDITIHVHPQQEVSLVPTPY